MTAKNRRYTAIAIFWAVMMALCQALSAAAALKIEPESQGSVSYRAYSSSVKFDVMEDLRNEIDRGSVTAWVQHNQKQARSTDIGSSRTVDAIWFDGDARDIWDLTLVSGSFPTGIDASCAIDEATANTLFGGTDIIGVEITVDGVEMTVCGVFKLPGGISTVASDPGYGLALCPAQAWTGQTELTIEAWEFTVYSAGIGGAASYAGDWMSAAGIQVPQSSYDNALSFTMFRQAADVCGWLAALYCAGAFVMAAWRVFKAGGRLCAKLLGNRVEGGRTAARVFAACALAGAAALALAGLSLAYGGFNAYAPPEYMPTQWSDFGFWRDMAVNLSQSAAKAARIPVFRPDAAKYTAKLLCLAFSALSIVTAFHALAFAKKIRLEKGSPGRVTALFFACAASPVVCSAAVSAMGFTPNAGITLALTPFMICFTPMLISYANMHVKTPLWAFHTRKNKANTERIGTSHEENNRQAV